ncbi:MAG: Rpp14/Pop5 family protein [Candidatus Bathyarchaeia archaeon]
MLKKSKRRYLALRVESSETFGTREFLEAVWCSIMQLYGEYGASKSGLKLIDYNEQSGLAIIRVAHTETEKVRAALASITEIASKPAAVHVLKVSGTIKALNKKVKQVSSGQ